MEPNFKQQLYNNTENFRKTEIKSVWEQDIVPILDWLKDELIKKSKSSKNLGHQIYVDHRKSTDSNEYRLCRALSSRDVKEKLQAHLGGIEISIVCDDRDLYIVFKWNLSPEEL